MMCPIKNINELKNIFPNLKISLMCNKSYKFKNITEYINSFNSYI